jgi:hypothetical protein
MAITHSAFDALGTAFTESPVAKAKITRKPGLLRRIFATMTAARMRQAEREVARYLADTGGKFTDEAEREIERRFLSNQTHW